MNSGGELIEYSTIKKSFVKVGYQLLFMVVPFLSFIRGSTLLLSLQNMQLYILQCLVVTNGKKRDGYLNRIRQNSNLRVFI